MPHPLSARCPCSVCAAENFDMTDVNILAELYMQLGNFTETHALITRARQAIKQLQQEVCVCMCVCVCAAIMVACWPSGPLQAL